jgi:beta-glucosidase
MPDLLHLNEQSYRIWAEAIEPMVKRLMGESS